MTGVPRRNERRFYRYPMGRMVAIIADEPHLDAALSDLRRAGVDPAGVIVLSGPGVPACSTAPAPDMGRSHECCDGSSAVRTKPTRCEFMNRH